MYIRKKVQKEGQIFERVRLEVGCHLNLRIALPLFFLHSINILKQKKNRKKEILCVTVTKAIKLKGKKNVSNILFM